MATYALYATASFHGQVVEESFVRSGEPLQLGNSPALAVPVPEGMPYVAQILWTGPTACQIRSGSGETSTLSPDRDVTIEVGAVSLRLALVEQYRLRRTQDFSAAGTLGWLSTIAIVMLFLSQAALLDRNYCPIIEWAGYQDARCMPQTAAGGGMFTAEYLARLLRDDLDGEDRGVVEFDLERPEADREVADDRIFLPAGNEGPITEMGGAQEISAEPVRTDAEPDIPVPQKRVDEETPLYAEDVGTPVPVNEEQVEAQEGQDDGLELEDAEQAEPENRPAEEEEGWGIPDWYDEQDRQIEEFQIEVTLRRMRQRLRIDPDDPAALQLLSYFQYLAGDLDGAEQTYNRIIELFPEEAAGYNNKALVYKRLGKYAEEEGLYRTALYFEPSDVTAMNNLAVNLSHQGRYDEALAIMDELEVLDPGQPYNDLHRAKIHAEIGNDEEALRYLRLALSGMARLDTLHHIEFRQDIRLDPSFDKLRRTERFRSILYEYYGDDTPLQE